MRNIANIDITKTPYELGYTNEGNTSNGIQLNIKISNLVNPYIEITKQDGTIENTSVLIPINNEILYTVPSSYIYATGSLSFRVRSEGFNSDYIRFNIPNVLYDTNNIIVKIEDENYLIRKVTANKTANIKVSATEPTAGEEIWFQNSQKNNIYILNDNGEYKSFVPSSNKGLTSDLNNATADGFYTWYKEATNRPWSDSNAWGCVVVQNNGGWIFQTAYATFDVDNARIAHRGYINGSWTSWCHTPTKDYIDNNKTRQYSYKALTRVTGNLSTGSWVTMCEDLSLSLPIGEYMLIFCPAVTGNGSGLTTFNPVIDGTRTSSVTRQSIPVASGLVTNSQCIVPLTVSTQKTYTFNVQQYSNVSDSVSAVGLYVYKLN